MSRLTDPAGDEIDFTYDPEGNLTETDLPNGVVTTNAYDPDGRMTRTTSANGALTLQDFTYAYDQNGNRTSLTDRNGDTSTYAYDQLNRLTEFDPAAGPAVPYAYDAAGNRTRSGDVTYTYDALNQLTTSSEGHLFGYDEAGRLDELFAPGLRTTYSYDGLDQLRGIERTGLNLGGGLPGLPGGGGSTPTYDPVTYDFDALGRRTKRSEGSAGQVVRYQGLTDVAIADENGSGSTTATYLQGPIGLVEQTDGSATSFPLADAHGDVTTLADAAGAVGSRQTYGPWGTQSSGPELEMGWLGAYERRSDPELGLMQMGVRQYAAGLGRFTSEDEVIGHLGLGQSKNRHIYVRGNPISMYDLTGRDPADPRDPCKDTPEAVNAVASVGDSVLSAGGLTTLVGIDPGPDIRSVRPPFIRSTSSVVVQRSESPNGGERWRKPSDTPLSR